MLKRAISNELFGGNTNFVNLGDYANVSTGTTPSTSQKDYYEGTNAYIKTGDIDSNPIRHASIFVSDSAIKKYRLKKYEPGTILLAMYGQGKTRGNTERCRD
jgi:type I restriction enzyme S subunit